MPWRRFPFAALLLLLAACASVPLRAQNTSTAQTPPATQGSADAQSTTTPAIAGSSGSATHAPNGAAGAPRTAAARTTPQTSGPWQIEETNTPADLRGIDSVGGGVAWASGTQGTVLRTEDSGYMWQGCAVPEGADALDFRGIVAWDANNAIVMSSGPGNASRLYKTTDGCSHWSLLYTDPDRDGFFDAVAFSDRNHGWILGDPVDGSYVLLFTDDGGQSWRKVQAPGLAADPSTSGAFAASNTAMILAGGSTIPWPLPLFVTGGTAGSMLYSSGNTCSQDMVAHDPQSCFNHWVIEHQRLPLASDAASAGAFSLAWVPGPDAITWKAVAVGGNFNQPESRTGTAAVFNTFTGHTLGWRAASTLPSGYRSGVSYDRDNGFWIAVGPNGSDVSRDDGLNWRQLEHFAASPTRGGEWNAVSLPFAVGPRGRIGKLNPGLLPK